MMQRLLLHAVMAIAAAFSILTSCANAASKRSSQPNIIFILVDDQDYHLGSMDHMDILQSQLIQQGTLFTKHYGHVSQCCPARATLWTGRHAHNTNVTTVVNGKPGGAWQQIQANGLHNRYLPVWLQKAGYQTYYSGKIYNGFGIKSYCDPVCLDGWTKADILVDPRTYSYYNSSYAHYEDDQWTLNHRVPGYSTDQIAQNVANFIEEASMMEAPFFAVAAPVAPHISTGMTFGNGTKFAYPLPKTEYRNLFLDLQLPRSPNFNPDNRTGVNAVWQLQKLTEPNIAALEILYRMRQRALKSVDDLIDTIVQRLDVAGVLDNTHIFYTSDNGYHIGNHRLQGGKLQCFEEDINIPFVVRGPGVGKNMTSDLVTGHIDVAPTLLKLAGVGFDPSWKLDGLAITFPMKDELDYFRNLEARGDSSHLEFWGAFAQEGPFGSINVRVHENLNIYKALRIQGKGYNLMYSVWCQNGAHELYDMSWDPYQMTNLHPDAPSGNYTTANAYNRGMSTILGRPTEQVINRLDALVLVQKTCTEDVCREPWKQLHPDGSVRTLTSALHEKYDDFYARSYSVAKVGWKQCYNGLQNSSGSTLYDLNNEQPLWLNQTVVQLVRSRATRPDVCSRWKWLLPLLGLLAVV